MGRRQTHTDPGVHVISGPLGAPAFVEGNSRGFPHFMGQGFRCRGARRHFRTGTPGARPDRRHRRRRDPIPTRGEEARRPYPRIRPTIGLRQWSGHKYLTLVYQIDLDVTRLLWVGRERTIESFQGFFTVIGDELASKIV